MTSKCTENRMINRALMFAGLMLTLTFLAQSASSQTLPADSGPAESQPSAKTYQTLYLTNLTQHNDVIDLLTDLRNMLPMAYVHYIQSQRAISVLGSPDDLLFARKMLSDLDRTRKVYRLTYTITETDSGTRVGTQRFVLIVASGAKTVLKQGTRVPVLTASDDAGSSTQNSQAQNSQVQYLDVGLNIEASVDEYLDGTRLRTRVEQSSLAEEKSGVAMQDPVIHQTTLEGTPILVQGKPLVLGSLDIPDSMRRQEIDVVSELVR